MIGRQQYAFEIGKQGEDYFQTLCDKYGLSYEKANTWYDFNVAGQKVEVKSCQLVVKNNPTRYKTGRWDFTNASQRTQLRDANATVCLLVQHGNQYMVYGFVPAKEIKQRYLSIPKARTLETITLEEWVEKNAVPF